MWVEGSAEVSRDSEGTRVGSGAQEDKGRGRELTRECRVYLSIVGPRLGDIAAHLPNCSLCPSKSSSSALSIPGQ